MKKKIDRKIFRLVGHTTGAQLSATSAGGNKLPTSVCVCVECISPLDDVGILIRRFVLPPFLVSLFIH